MPHKAAPMTAISFIGMKTIRARPMAIERAEKNDVEFRKIFNIHGSMKPGRNINRKNMAVTVPVIEASQWRYSNRNDE